MSVSNGECQDSESQQRRVSTTTSVNNDECQQQRVSFTVRLSNDERQQQYCQLVTKKNPNRKARKFKNFHYYLYIVVYLECQNLVINNRL